MSATGRNLPGQDRRADDFYQTPAWCVRALLRSIELPGGRWLEPSAGSGAIVRACAGENWEHPRFWHLCESRAGEEQRLYASLPSFINYEYQVEVGDFLTLPSFDEVIGQPKPFDVCIGNPPYSLAQEFADRALGCSRAWFLWGLDLQSRVAVLDPKDCEDA